MTTENREIQGVETANINNQSKMEFPRDKRGKIRWKLLGEDPQVLQGLIRAEAINFYQQERVISQRLLVEKGRGDLAAAIGKFYPGGLSQLKRDFIDGFHKKPAGYWQSPENILIEAEEFLTTHQAISQRLLIKNDNSSLSAAITRSYPGGTRQLRRDLGIKVSKRPNQFWNKDRIEQEAREFYELHGRLNSRLLLSEGKNDLLVAISRKYPNKWYGLYRELGLQSPQKEKGYWTPEIIKQEAKAFFEEHGILSLEKLQEAGKGDLGSAIFKRYPGKMGALKRQLGVIGNIDRRKGVTGMTEEDRKIFIEKQAQELAADGIEITGAGLRQQYRYLLASIQRYYPGGIKTLRNNLGLPESRDYLKISPEQANEQLRKLLEE